MTTTPFNNALNAFAEYLEYEFQAELALQSSHLNLPERIHKEDFLKEYIEDLLFPPPALRQLIMSSEGAGQTYTAQVCREKLYPIINNTI